ncbi:MAG: hypothetical protein ACYS8X_06855 [Planctomycetota bacterium]|jgi:phenylacetate-CoA ligase
MSNIPIGIITYNRPVYLATAVNSVLASELPAGCAMVIFDDCSDDPIQREYLTTDREVRLPGTHRFPTDSVWRRYVGELPDVETLHGIGGRLDVRIARKSHGSVDSQLRAVRTLFDEHPKAPGVIVMEDDVIVVRDWYSRLVEAFGEHEELGVLAGANCWSDDTDHRPRVRRVHSTGAQLYLYGRRFYEANRESFLRSSQRRRAGDEHVCGLVRESGYQVGVIRPAVCQHIGSTSKNWPDRGYWDHQRYDRTFVPARCGVVAASGDCDRQEGPASGGEIAADLIVGHGYMSPLLNLDRTQWLNTGSLREIQAAFLRRLLVEACNNVSYWRKALNGAGIDPRAVGGIEDLRALPVLTKQSFEMDGQRPILYCRRDMLHKDVGLFKKIEEGTSGSEGELFHYLVSAEAGSYYANQCRNRSIGWAGVDFGNDKVAVLSGGRMVRGEGICLKGNKLFLPAFNMGSASALQGMADSLTWYKPKGMRALPSALYDFCQYLRQEGWTLSVEAVVTTGEMLYDHQRQLIEETLGCRVFNEYGAWDGGAGAAECEEHNGLHWHMERSIVEILDDDDHPVEPGQLGRVVLTDLHNYLMPFIRYAIGDWAILSQRTCPCGRGLLLLDKVLGRSSDFIALPNGKRAPGRLVVGILFKAGKKFQCTQRADGSLHVSVVRFPHRTFEETRQSVLDTMAEELPGLSVSVTEVDDISVPRSGKHRLVISEMPGNQVGPR